jgi:hypothetical protein
MVSRWERLFALAILVVTVGAAVLALSLNPIARRMPLMVAAYTLVCLAGYFFFELRSRQAGGGQGEASPFAATDRRMLGWILAFLGLVMTLGLIPGVAVFTILFSRYESRSSWRESLVFGVGLSLAIWLTFSVALNESLYAGVLELL